MSTSYQSFTAGANASMGRIPDDMPSTSPPIITTSASSPNHPDKTMQGAPSSSPSGPSLLGNRGGSLKIKDTWKRIAQEEYETGPYEQNVEGAAGLLRHTSLPGRSVPPAISSREPKTTSVSRTTSTRSSRHPSISEEGPPPNMTGLSSMPSGSRDMSLGRSSSLKHVMEKKDWRGRAVGTMTADDSAQNVPIGHHRSYSHSSTSPSTVSMQDHGNALSVPHLSRHSHLFKSNSLRSTYSDTPRGHAHSQSMSYQESPPSSATPTSTFYPQHGGIDSLPVSPTEAEAHSHLGHGFPHRQQTYLGPAFGDAAGGGPDGGEEGTAAMLKRHQSLQQGYGKSHRVADRLARSQAILAVGDRTSVMDVPPTSPIGRNAWSTAAAEDDGWNDFQQGRPPIGFQGQAVEASGGPRDGGQSGANSRVEDMDPVRRLRLLQAMEAMQLGSEMVAPAESQPGLVASPGLASSAVFGSPAAGISYDQPRAYGSAAIAQGAYGAVFGSPAMVPRYGMQTEHAPSDFYAHQDYAPANLSVQQDPRQQQGYAHMGYGNQHGYQVSPSTSFSPGPYHGFVTGTNDHIGAGPPGHSEQYQPRSMQQYSYGRSPLTPAPATARSADVYPKTAPIGGGQKFAPSVDIPPEIAEAAAQEVREMVEKRGLNPTVFNCEVADARYFVIKSFTEDDVQKSLKHEIWSSTNFGNQRLDKAFNEARGPVYLFFSVNGSGHFCGMAQLESGVNYNESSTVWAQSKWKGIMKLRWIFVKDVPNAALRHIRLLNMPEQKPITNSRDTQELLRDAGVEVLTIMSTFREKTSLLHDYGYYEMQAAERSRQMTTQPSGREATPTNSMAMGSTGPPPIIVSTIQHRTQTPGLVRTFDPSGPPSLTNTKRFAVTSRGVPQQGHGYGPR